MVVWLYVPCDELLKNEMKCSSPTVTLMRRTVTDNGWMDRNQHNPG